MKKFEVLAEVQHIVMNVVNKVDIAQQNQFSGRSYSAEQVRNILLHTLEELENYIGNQEEESCSKSQIDGDAVKRIVEETSDRITYEIQDYLDNYDGCDCIQLDFSGYGSSGEISASVNLNGEIDVADVIRRSELKQDIAVSMAMEFGIEL
jgi:hypothetical protein